MKGWGSSYPITRPGRPRSPWADSSRPSWTVITRWNGVQPLIPRQGGRSGRRPTRGRTGSSGCRTLPSSGSWALSSPEFPCGPASPRERRRFDHRSAPNGTTRWSPEAGYTHLFLSQMPPAAAERIGFADRGDVHLVLLLFAILAFASLPMVMLGRWLLARRFDNVPHPVCPPGIGGSGPRGTRSRGTGTAHPRRLLGKGFRDTCGFHCRHRPIPTRETRR